MALPSAETVHVSEPVVEACPSAYELALASVRVEVLCWLIQRWASHCEEDSEPSSPSPHS